MIKNYILIAIRNLLRNKTVSFINIFGLAVSMSICLLLIIIVADQMSYDQFHTNKDRVYRVITDRTQQKEYVWSTATTAMPLADKVSQHTTVKKIAQIRKNFSGVANWGQQEIPFYGYYTNNDFLQIFDFPLANGNSEEALSTPNSVVLTQKLAHKIFGDKNPLNEVIQVEGQGELTVKGVFAEFPGKTHFDFEALASINHFSTLQANDSTYQSPLNDWDEIYSNYIYIQLEKGASAESLQPILEKAAASNYDPEGDFTYKFMLQPLTGITPGPLLSNNTGFGLPDFMVYIMLGIALVVLCSACFNYANLTTAKAVNRAKEIGVRKVVGAGRRHIFMQFMLEAIIIAVVAFIFADLMAQYLLPQLNNFFTSLGAPISFDETPNLYVWFVAFVLLAGLLAGLVPALFFSATNPLSALKKSFQFGALSRKMGFQRFDIRKILVVVQFVFTIFFVITIITIYQQTRFVLNTDHGFKTEGVLNVHLQGMDYEKIAPAFEELANVHAVASTTHLPALGTNNTMEVMREATDEPTNVSYFGVDNKYVTALDIQLIAGSNFPEIMPENERYMLVNETFIRKFGWENAQEAVGQVVQTGDLNMEIIGVVKDFHYERLDEEIGPMALRYLPKYANSAIVMINTKSAKETVVALEKIWKQHTNRPFEYTFYEDDLRLSYGHFEALLMILGYVTVITVSIACLGLLGMIMYHVQNKTKEIGIRKTLGAEAYHILKTIGKSFLILIIIAYSIGGPLAYFVNDLWLSTNAYRIDFGLPTLLIGFLAVLLLVSITVGSQLFKAMRINPVDSLKTE